MILFLKIPVQTVFTVISKSRNVDLQNEDKIISDIMVTFIKTGNNKYNVERINLRNFPGLDKVIQHTEEIIHSAKQTNALLELTYSILYRSTI
jgi:hypothetical protein